MTEITIQKDDEAEMMCVFVGDVCVFEGNFWDMNDDIWIELIRSANVSVLEEVYHYG